MCDVTKNCYVMKHGWRNSKFKIYSSFFLLCYQSRIGKKYHYLLTNIISMFTLFIHVWFLTQFICFLFLSTFFGLSDLLYINLLIFFKLYDCHLSHNITVYSSATSQLQVLFSDLIKILLLMMLKNIMELRNGGYLQKKLPLTLKSAFSFNLRIKYRNQLPVFVIPLWK